MAGTITSAQFATLKATIEIARDVPSTPFCKLICATVEFVKDEGTAAQLEELCDMTVVQNCNCGHCPS